MSKYYLNEVKQWRVYVQDFENLPKESQFETFLTKYFRFSIELN